MNRPSLAAHRLHLALLLATAFCTSRPVGAAAPPPDPHPLKPHSGLPPFQYQEAPDRLPNYLPSEKWGTQGAPLTQMQAPLSPEESARHLVTQPGFSVQLWAAEPQIVKPIALAWDERGRLWIAETVDYPNELQTPGQGRDRIKICEDTDGDGRADKFTVFADKLSIPTSLCFANGGLIVLEGGHTLFLKDTNGDDVADERRVLFSGWGMEDTHATASNLRYGYDGWIWGTVGYSGFEGTVGGREIKFSMGIYRFRPDGSELEFVRSSNNNTWGLGLSEEGVVFGSTANNNASWHMAVPNRFYERVRGWAATRMETIANSQNFYPITSKVRQVDAHGRYTAGAGHALYTGRSFPEEYWNRTAFVAEPTGHLVGWFRLEGSGSDFRAVNQGSFLASDDEWTAPIVAEVGPDGALWVIDWYNYIVQHNPVPNGFKNGRGNAYDTTLRDKRHGRIYRVTATGAKAAPKIDLSKASPAELVAALKHPTQLVRLHAQRLLVERGEVSVVPALAALTRDLALDSAGLNVGAVHALRVLQGLKSGEPGIAAPVAALKHPSAGVRQTAVAALARTPESVTALVDAKSCADSAAQVRLAALLALAEMPSEVPAGEAIFAALQDPTNTSDRWLRDALTAAVVQNGAPVGELILNHPTVLPEGALEVVRNLARHAAADAPSFGPRVVVQTAALPAATTEAILAGFAQGWPEGQRPAFEAAHLRDAMSRVSPTAQAEFLLLAQKWNAIGEFPALLAKVTEASLDNVRHAAGAEPARIAAARALIRLADTEANQTAVLHEITPTTPPTLSAGLLEAVGGSRLGSTGSRILSAWKNYTPAARRTAVAQLMRRPAWSESLLDAVAKGDLLPGDLGPQQWQQLGQSTAPKLAQRARELQNAGKGLSADREGVVKQFLPAAGKAGNATRGKELFTANCAVCHKVDGVGQNIGPDLSGIGARPKSEILTEILDPNRSVEANYRLWNVTTKSGETWSGRLDGETSTSIELLDLTGQKHTLQRSTLASVESSNQSIMPVGFESLGEADLASLLEYLAGTRH